MTDSLQPEARRLSAAWLNTMAAGLASAGLLSALHALIVGDGGEAAVRMALLALASLGGSGGLHLMARRLLRTGADRERVGTPPQGDR
jgi:hypothetical protein